MELGIDSPDDDLPEIMIEGLNTTVTLRVKVSELATRVVDAWTVVPEAILGQPLEDSGDGVNNYAHVLCHLASLVAEFYDGWREGDGPRMLRCWKILMLHFYANRNTKYAIESLRLQFQLATLPPYLVHQLTWGRFVNTHGGAGHNIPCDLYIEHVNRLFKDIISNMGANFTEQSSTRAARCVTTLASIAETFNHQTGIHPESTAHTTASNHDHVLSVAQVVRSCDILSVRSGRSHSNFLGFAASPLSALKRDDLEKWIKQKVKEHGKPSSMVNDIEEMSENGDSDESDNEEV